MNFTNLAVTNKINGASWEAAGNLISFTGSALTYDAENRITSATQSGIGSMYYLYDGAGRRVQEVSTYNVEKVFVYDAFGQMAAEYSLGAQSLPCTTCYIATDHLGSTRMVTDQNANVVGRHDYLPFGEEIAANTGGRNSLFGTQDFVNQKFTGQERDAETGLDFFQARYLSAALGRFNSPDPENAGADLFNPQSWNAYTYVYNNPLSLIDPSGTSPFDGFNPSPDDPCADDPFICGDPGFPYPDFPSPWPSAQPQPPPPPPPPAPIVIPHTGGVFAQGQIGSSGNALLPVAAGAGGGAVVLDIGIGTLCVGTGVCEIIAAGAAIVAVGAGAYIIYRKLGPSGKPMVHNPKYNTKKGAREAAKLAGQGDPENHANDPYGPHYHSVDANGKIIKDGVHHHYPE